MKQYLLQNRLTLRSKRPDMVRQELWGVLLAYNRHSAPNFENTLCDECHVTERPINNFLTPMVSCISVARLSCQGMTRSQMS